MTNQPLSEEQFQTHLQKLESQLREARGPIAQAYLLQRQSYVAGQEGDLHCRAEIVGATLDQIAADNFPLVDRITEYALLMAVVEDIYPELKYQYQQYLDLKKLQQESVRLNDIARNADLREK